MDDPLDFILYEDEFGDTIEVHYFRHPGGTVGDVKIKEWEVSPS